MQNIQMKIVQEVWFCQEFLNTKIEILYLDSNCCKSPFYLWEKSIQAALEVKRTFKSLA